MIQSLSAGVSGIQQFQEKLDVIGNNIANSNTLGFKSGRADFEDTFSQTMTGGTSPIQIGSGVSTGTVQSMFGQGTITATGNPTDVAIDGDGFFTVRDPVSGKEFATRAGNFNRDSQGYLVTAEGYRVQGYQDAGLGAPGDIRIDETGQPNGGTALMNNFNIDKYGKVHIILDDGAGTDFVRGQILLQKFQNPGALVKEGKNLYSGITAAGPLAASVAPDTNGVGTISSEHLEMSNVDLAAEFADLITTQRGFQASARIITTSDEMLQEVVNLKH
ncbi:MAG TPA: flagellar hook-basal body complex protein [Verrucomicrobiae bacterium]|nr:flagellar hook-basal body complex protein [Verrucomicrobiae bacterium]